MITHDPTEYIRGIQQILISDKKKIGFLFGAGSSLAKKNGNSLTVPAIQPMTEAVIAELVEENSNYKTIFNELKEQEIGANNFNIENILTSLEQKHQVIGNGSLNGLDKTGLESLIDRVKTKIREKVSVHDNLIENGEADLIQTDYAEWIRQADRKYPIEIFTTNYDYLFELAFEHKNIPYYSGFSGSFEPFFDADSVESFKHLPLQTKLWKLHGSLGWHLNAKTGKVTLKPPSENAILIYPSTLKYKNSKKQPYTSLMDRLSNFLRQDDTVLFTCGYSFNDEHINERIVSALKTNSTSHLVALYHDKVWDDSQKKYVYKFNSSCELYRIAEMNNKVTAIAHRAAMIGCKFGQWKLRSEPDKEDSPHISLYFDEDASLDESSPVGEEKKGGEVWSGTGEFFLSDFSKLVMFLKSMIINNQLTKEEPRDC